MYLKSITVKGFKSFPDRTRLEFGPGVSVIVGPNGSGKSNVTDAVLWALGEQSPVAVRGQSMQDVIFAGAPGRQAAKQAEVELVLDDSQGSLALGAPEVSIYRRLDRTGEGEYRLAGARCRLVDVVELLSDTGLGKEMHSVISQGRVESLVTSKPRDRRLLIEEAAGLGKHRKRRRRAQLKLARTQDNLDRVLDIEREARSRLRPLKRQAEAAELHARLERQTLEGRWELSRDALARLARSLEQAEQTAAAVRSRRQHVEAELGVVASRRDAAEEALAARSAQREELSRRAFAARSAAERVSFRADAVRSAASTIDVRLARAVGLIGGLRAAAEAQQPDREAESRIAALRESLAALDRDRQSELARQLQALEGELAAAEVEAQRHGTIVEEQQGHRLAAEVGVEQARAAVRDSERAVEQARREAARVGAELAAVNQFLRHHSGVPGGRAALADELEVDPGYELALAAALDGRLGAALVDDRDAGGAVLDRAGAEGGRTLVTGGSPAPDLTVVSGGSPALDLTVASGGSPAPDLTVVSGGSPAPVAGADRDGAIPPAPGAQRLTAHVRGQGGALALARALLTDTWVVDDLARLPPAFAEVAVTRAGRVWSPRTRELRQAPAVGEERVLAERNRREQLVKASEAAARSELSARAESDRLAAAATQAESVREQATTTHRAAVREQDEAAEERRRLAALIARRRSAPDDGPDADRRAQLTAQLATENRMLQRAEGERTEREARIARLELTIAHDQQLIPAVRGVIEAIDGAAEAISHRLGSFDAALVADRQAGEHVAGELRSCAAQEATMHAQLQRENESLTEAEVRLQRARDQEADARAELQALATRLALAAEPAEEELTEEERASLRTRVERLERRREQLGPVNPLAQEEYDEALAHVEELEAQRADLETALRELQKLIGDTDRQIRETFERTLEATARNFEELAGELFPGGTGRLRLVTERDGPARVLGGQSPPAAEGSDADGAGDELEEPDREPEEDLLGVEIEITPAGKEMKRLTLLSGGEKAMTALAFLFSVFLARPCPFYILDEVEAALDDLNIDRFLTLLRAYSSRAQFIVVTHQKRTMEAADSLYGVSMCGDGISKVISRRLAEEDAA